MKVIIWMHPNSGVVAITSVAPEYSNSLEALNEIAQKVVAKDVYYKIIDQSELPTDMTYRDAWVVELNEFNSDGLGTCVY